MTEASHQIASNPLPPRLRRFGSVSLPTGSTRAAILDEQGKPLPANAVGEICIRGENVIAACPCTRLAACDLSAGLPPSGSALVRSWPYGII